MNVNKALSLMSARRLDTYGIINLRNDSNKALIQANKNETTFVLNKGNPLDTSGYTVQNTTYLLKYTVCAYLLLALISCALSEEDPFHGVIYSNLGHF